MSLPGLPETAPTDPVLTDVFHVGGLRKELVDLVAYVELLVVLEVSSGQLFLDPGQDLESASVLCFAGFGGDTFLGIEDAALENGRSTTRKVARLYAVLEIDAFNDRLATLRCK
jgi:hypothetical protein